MVDGLLKKKKKRKGQKTPQKKNKNHQFWFNYNATEGEKNKKVGPKGEQSYKLHCFLDRRVKSKLDLKIHKFAGILLLEAATTPGNILI